MSNERDDKPRQLLLSEATNRIMNMAMPWTAADAKNKLAAIRQELDAIAAWSSCPAPLEQVSDIRKQAFIDAANWCDEAAETIIERGWAKPGQSGGAAYCADLIRSRAALPESAPATGSTEGTPVTFDHGKFDEHGCCMSMKEEGGPCWDCPHPAARSASAPTPTRIPDLQDAEDNAGYWKKGAWNEPNREQALMAMEQAVNRWKNAAYAMADQRDAARSSSTAHDDAMKALRTLKGYNEDIRDGKINFRHDDHLHIIELGLNGWQGSAIAPSTQEKT